MNSEETLRLAFWTLIGLTVVLRLWFVIQLCRAGERLLPDRVALQREGWLLVAIRLAALLLLLVGLLLFGSHPGWRTALAVRLSPGLRWCGFALGLTSLGLWAWTHSTLGTLWSPQLQLRADHRLIISGPFSKIRHPMYTAILGWVFSLGFVCASWIPFSFAVVATIILVGRAPREEQMMLGQFGDEYREYMKRTGRFLPKWQV